MRPALHTTHPPTLLLPAAPPAAAVGMCAGTQNMGQDWGGKCTIDAKRLWKIFYITPGGGGGSANIRVST